MKDTKKESIIGDILTGLTGRLNAELVNKNQNELEEYWFFIWNDSASVEWNTYQFFDCLGLYRRQCRRWEEHHNGSCCVVERVRDKYLMPKISNFIEKLQNSANH